MKYYYTLYLNQRVSFSRCSFGWFVFSCYAMTHTLHPKHNCNFTNRVLCFSLYLHEGKNEQHDFSKAHSQNENRGSRIQSLVQHRQIINVMAGSDSRLVKLPCHLRNPVMDRIWSIVAFVLHGQSHNALWQTPCKMFCTDHLHLVMYCF